MGTSGGELEEEALPGGPSFTHSGYRSGPSLTRSGCHFGALLTLRVSILGPCLGIRAVSYTHLTLPTIYSV